MTVERESIDFDVLFVGGGPASLAGAIKLMQLAKEKNLELEVALIENIQREDLNPLEVAEAYERLLRSDGVTQQDVAQRVRSGSLDLSAGSIETRGLIRISERGVSKSILMQLSKDEMQNLAATNHISIQTFTKNYVVFRSRNQGVCIFQATYLPTDQARPPDDGKLREIKPDLSWQTVGGQHILPKPGVWKYPPLPFNVIYS